MKAFYALLASLVFASLTAHAQESWSDSRPKIMTIFDAQCPVKVKGLSGEWSSFKEKFPKGRTVIGAINPRQPDVVFFQLARDSKFSFVAPRTCFDGEQDWNNEKKVLDTGFISQKKSRKYMQVELRNLQFKPKLVGPADESTLKASLTSVCLGAGWEKNKKQWSMGADGCAGTGLAFGRSTNDGGPTFSQTNVFSFYGLVEGHAYYNFKDVPYAAGLELSGGYLYAPFESDFVNSTISPHHIMLNPSVGFRFYADNWMFTPKLTFYKLLPRNLGFDIQAAYFWEGR